MKNGIEDLRNHLFAQIERLGDEELKGDALKEEINRAGAIGDISKHILDSARAETDRIKVLRRASSTDFIKTGDYLDEDGIPFKTQPEDRIGYQK